MVARDEHPAGQPGGLAEGQRWRLVRQGRGDHLAGDQLPVGRVDPVDQAGLPADRPLGVGRPVRRHRRAGDQDATGRGVAGSHVGQHRRVDQRALGGRRRDAAASSRWVAGEPCARTWSGASSTAPGSRSARRPPGARWPRPPPPPGSPRRRCGRARAPTSMTRWSSRTVPAGRLAASSSGSREIPVDGTAGEPSRKERISSRTNVADVVPSQSASTPARKGSSTAVRSSPEIPARSRASARREIRGREQPADREQAGQGPADERRALAEGPDGTAQRGGQQPGESARVGQDGAAVDRPRRPRRRRTPGGRAGRGRRRDREPDRPG